VRTRDKLHFCSSYGIANNYAIDRHICHAWYKEVVKSILQFDSGVRPFGQAEFPRGDSKLFGS